MNTMIAKLAETLQKVLGPSLDDLGRRSGVIQRQRKFSGETLLKMLVLTLFKSPAAKLSHYVGTAAKLGLIVTPEAVQKRFTPELVDFLRMVLGQVLETVVASQPVAVALLQKFTSVRIGDSTTIAIPDEYAKEFPGCGGKSGSGKASLKIQVLWDLLAGQLITLVLEPGSRSDAKSALLEGPVPAGSLSILDLGYFCLKRFSALAGYGAFWISRWQQGTMAFHPDGRPLDLLEFARKHKGNGPIDIAILLGAGERVACRLIMLRVPQDVANRRRQKAYKKAQKHGRTPTQEHLAWCDWTVYVTNCLTDLLTWQEVVVLYRSRWQIELMFKLWKSQSGLDKHKIDKSAVWQMAELFAKLIGVVIQHWLLLTSTWLNPRRSLWKAAQVIRDWGGAILEALNDFDRLCNTLERMKVEIDAAAKVGKRCKHPSSFQLLSNPELLDWNN